jgi:hypothetical protein
MPRTPDRFPGEREDEGVILRDQGPAGLNNGDPTAEGGVRYVTDQFRLRDGFGVYNGRPIFVSPSAAPAITDDAAAGHSVGMLWLRVSTGVLYVCQDSTNGAAVWTSVVRNGDKGDITVSGDGTTWTVDNDVVSNAKAANVPSPSLKGRTTPSAGDPEDLTLVNSTSNSWNTATPGSLSVERAALTGEVTAPANSNATTIAANAVTNTKAADMASPRLKGRTTATTGDPEDLSLVNSTTNTWNTATGGSISVERTAITGVVAAAANSSATTFGAGVDGAGLTLSGGNTALDVVGSTSIVVTSDQVQRAALTGEVTAPQNSNATTIANDAVTNAKLANVASPSLKGRTTATTGDPEDLTLVNSTSNTWNTATGGSLSLERAALTGDITAPANSNTTAIAAGVIVDADINAAAAIAQTKTGALIGDVTKASGSDTTAIAAGVVVDADINASAAIALSKLAAQAANTIVANPTASSAVPTTLAVAADSIPARVGSNLVSHPLATLSGAGLTYAAGVVDVGGSTSVVVGASDIQRAALTGDVTASQNSNATTIANDAVTNAKLANVTSPSLKGRTTATTGDPEDLTLVNSTSNTWNTATGGSISLERAALTGDVAASANSNATTIQPNAVTNAKLADVAVGTVKGLQVDAAGAGDPVDLTGAELAEITRRDTIQTLSGVSGALDVTLNNDATVLLVRTTADAAIHSISAGFGGGREIVIEHDRLSGTGNLTLIHNSGTGTLFKLQLPNGGNLVLGQGASVTVRDRSSFWRYSSSGPGVFSSTTHGLVPPSGGGTVNFLRADNSFALPVPDGDRGDVTVSGSGATWTVDNDVVTNAKLANVTSPSLKGRTTATTGDPEDLTLVNSTSVAWNTATGGSVSVERAALTGDVTAPANSNTTTVANDVVTNAKLANVTSPSLKGRTTAATGDPEDLTLVNSTSNSWNTTTGGSISLERAALTGDVTASANSNTTAIAPGVIIDADVNAAAAIAQTKTGALIGDVTKASGSDTTAIAAGVIVDADINAAAAIALSKLATQAANTLVANPTASGAVPTVLAVAADSVPARVGGNLVSHPLATLSGAGLTYAAGVVDVGGSTSVIVGASDVQRAALTGDVTASQNSNATTIANDAVSNAKLADMGAGTVKGRQIDAITGDPVDLTGLEVGELLRVGTTQAAVLAAATNDLALSADTTVLRVSSTTGGQNLTGLTGGTNGRLLFIENIGADGNSITLTSQDPGSLAANRFRTPRGIPIELGFRDSAIARWDTGNGDWRVVVAGAPGITVLANGANPLFWSAFDFDDTATVDFIFANNGGGQLNIAASVIDDSITNTKLANMAAGTAKGRALGGGTGDPQDLTGAQQGENIRYTTTVLDSTSTGSITSYAQILDATTQVRFTGAAAATIHGISTGSGLFGKRIEFHVENGVAAVITFAHESGSATGEKLRTPSGLSLVLRANESVSATYYDNRWRFTAVSRASVGDADYGDITVSGGGTAWTIDANVVTNVKAADMADSTIKGRALGAGLGDPTDLSNVQVGQIVRYNTGTDTTLAPGTYNDLAIATGPLVRYLTTADGDIIITGIAYAPSNSGGFLRFFAWGATPLRRFVFKHSNGGSLAANQIKTPNGLDYILTRDNDAVEFQYIGGRWQLMASFTRGFEVGDYLRYSTLQDWPLLAVGTFNNWVAAENVKLIRIEPATAGDVNITGFAFTNGNTGLTFRLFKKGATGRVVLKHQAVTSSVGNRLALPGGQDFILTDAETSVELQFIDGAFQAIDEGTITNAMLADMAQSTILGRAEGAGTGDPQNLTPTQVVAIIDAESPTWTGNHTWNSATFTAATSGDMSLTAADDVLVAATTGSVSISAGAVAPSILGDGVVGIVATGDSSLAAPRWNISTTVGTMTLAGFTGVGITAGSGFTAQSGTAGLGLYAGHTAVGVSVNDLVLNAIGGIGIKSDLTTPVTSVTNGNIEIDAFNRIVLRTPGFVQVEASNDMWLSTLAGGIELNTLTGAHPTGVTNGQINFNSQTSINATALTDSGLTAPRWAITANVGSLTFNSTLTTTFNVTTSFIVNTAGVERLEIENDGAWQLGGSAGTTGQTIVNAGSAAPPAWGQLPTAGIADDGVTNAKLANMADSTVKGRARGAGAGDPTDLTGNNVGAIIRYDNTMVGTAGTVATEAIGVGTNVITYNAVTSVVHGFSTPAEVGQLLIVRHIGTGTLTLVHNSSTATLTSDRMILGDGYTANSNAVVLGGGASNGGCQTILLIHHGGFWHRVDNALAVNSVPHTALLQNSVQVISPSTQQDNLVINPTTRVLDVTPTGDVLITGFAVNGGLTAGNANFGFHIVKNGFAGRVILPNNSAGSLAGNRVVNSNIVDLVLEHAVDSVYVQYNSNFQQWYTILPKASKMRINSTGGWNTREKWNAIAGTGMSLSIGDNSSERETNLTIGVNTAANLTWTGTQTFGQVLKNTGVYTQTAFTLDTNDLAVGNVSVVRLGDPAISGATSDQFLTGIVPVGGDGQLLWLESMFSGDRAFYLVSESSGSVAANRFSIFGGFLKMSAKMAVLLRYNGVLQRWVVAYTEPFLGDGLARDQSTSVVSVRANSNHFTFLSGVLSLDLAAALAWTGAVTFNGFPAGYAASAALLARSTTASSTSTITVVTTTIAANALGAGSAFIFHCQAHCSRGATLTATNYTLSFRVGGSTVLTATVALNTTASSSGALRMDGEFTILGAVGASAAVGVVGTYQHTLTNATPVTLMPLPSTALTAATNASLTLDIRMQQSVNAADITFTPLSAYIQRIR